MKLKNILVVLTPILFLNLCGPDWVCPDPITIYFDISAIETSAPDTAFSEEISFQVRLYNPNRPLPFSASRYGSFGISRAYGLSCIAYFLVPNQLVTGVQLITVHALSPEVPASTDVTDRLYSRTGGFLYVPISEFVNHHLNRSWDPENPQKRFRVYFKGRVQHPIAQFVLHVNLSDGRVLSDTTSIIRIISN